MRDVVARFVRVLLSAWLLVTSLGIGALGAMRAADLAGRVVTTGSMAPTIPVDSLVLIGTADPGEIATGDVISYRRPENREQLVLHRVVEVLERPDGRYFRTKGDANAQNDAHPVSDVDVVGRLRGHLPGVGALVGWLQPPWGVAFLAGIPLASLLVGTPRQRRRADEAEPAPRRDAVVEPIPRQSSPAAVGLGVGLRPAVALAAAAWTLGAASHQQRVPRGQRTEPGSRARGGWAHTNNQQGAQR